MASQRDIRRRISSVESTRKITKAMQMVAAARLRRAQQHIESTRPYADNMMEFIGGLAKYLPAYASTSPLIQEHEELKTVAIIALTADRGLCGSFNSNIIRQALERYKEYSAQGKEIHLVAVGRKGISTLRFQGYSLHATYADITDRSAFLDAQALAHRVAWRYSTNQVDRVHLIYNAFKSAMEQQVTDEVILPIQEDLAAKYSPKEGGSYMDFIFEPSEDTILADLIPSYLEITIYRALLESMASEYGARMTAMASASDAANDMIDELTLAMNRLRQTSITNEILEVVAGADAVSG
jgi:F-type H+-transporting ATPase subunit gamma